MRNPAKNINEFVNNLLLGHLTTEEEHFYVPLYQDKLTEIRDRLIYDDLNYQTIYIMGQVGTGKTTALNFLPDQEINEKFEVVSLYATDLFDMNDIDIADVLLMIAHKLMKGHSILEKKFKSELERIQKKVEGTLSEEKISQDGYKLEGGGGLGASIGNNPIGKFLGLLNAKLNVFANIRMDKNSRLIVREVFNASPRDIFGLTNKIIEIYNEKIVSKGKKLLLVINELDHVRNGDKIMKLFVDNRYYLDHLKCRKVISVPVVLMTFGEFKETREVTNDYIGLKLTTNPIVEFSNSNVLAQIEHNKVMLRQIALKRISEDVNLINTDALEVAIEKSGGILRQYIKILSHAGRRVRRSKGQKISLDDVEFGASRVRQELESSLIGAEKITLLEEVRLRHNPTSDNKDLLIECLLANQILAFKNEPTWYSLNPLLENTVKIYASTFAEK